MPPRRAQMEHSLFLPAPPSLKAVGLCEFICLWGHVKAHYKAVSHVPRRRPLLFLHI